MQIYSVDTSAFYNEKEMKIHSRLNKTYRFRTHLKKIKNKKSTDDKLKDKVDSHITYANNRIKKLKELMYELFKQNNEVRKLNNAELRNKNVISVFDSVLTRVLKLQPNQLYKDIIVVQTYFFDILEDIIINGFTYDNEGQEERFVCLTASAGQIRTKKTVFIKESLFLEHQNTLMCGLTVDKINQKGGVNNNKYLAYLALCNSATDIWTDFDIDRTIIVDDLETNVPSWVDFIDENTYEIERKFMDVPISHTDGCGMILPRKSKKSKMIRLPWIKGLLVPFPYDKFIREQNKKSGSNCSVVKDIYGKEWDIIKDGIEVIMTKSQFKMHKYYSSWDEYKTFYKQYNCQAGMCNEEEDILGDAKLNYQMLQTLTDMTDDELITISKKTKNSIVNIGKDKDTMLKVLGVVDSNTNKNYIQQALEIYPELLNDTYSKEILKKVKKSLVKEARSGKLDIKGKYTFICPDLYAFCEFIFLDELNPQGLLNDGEVYCNLYKNESKIDCLRSPHLYREHAVRKNAIDPEKARWFVTKGLYTSVHDVISKILMFDVDGDKSLVCADKTIIEAAERNMKDIVPLFYNMAKADAQIIDNTSIYNGLKAAYTGGNIGEVSNNITKIWNSEDVNLDVIKWQCMENNFVIDYAKTLYKVTRPKNKKKLITSYTKVKTPHFFIYAKDKTKDQVEKINSSVVNRLEKIIPNPRINFKATNLGKFDNTMLMSSKDIKLDQEIIDKYTELDLRNRFMNIVSMDDETTQDTLPVYKDIREQILKVNSDINYVVDVLVEHLYNHKKSSYKTTLWSSFGDIIVKNLKNNMGKSLIDERIQCESCGERIEASSNRKKYCEPCRSKVRGIQNKEKALRYYYKDKI